MILYVANKTSLVYFNMIMTGICTCIRVICILCVFQYAEISILVITMFQIFFIQKKGDVMIYEVKRYDSKNSQRVIYELLYQAPPGGLSYFRLIKFMATFQFILILFSFISTYYYNAVADTHSKTSPSDTQPDECPPFTPPF